ncbi:MAG: serine protease, partial [Chloroflexi bacterium]|nr:serine protease [Chloroflexota bacterium]
MAIGLLPLEQDLWQRLNLERTKAGINPLTIDDDLVAVARERSQSMVNLNYFDHTAPDGQTAFSLMAARGITYRNAGEDLASNNYPDDVSPAVAIDYLMNSATHTNILMADYHRIGIGLAISSDGTKYY